MIFLFSLILFNHVLASNTVLEDGVLSGPYSLKTLHYKYFEYKVSKDRGKGEVVTVLELDGSSSETLEVYGSCRTESPSIINNKWSAKDDLVLNWYDLNSCQSLYLGVYNYKLSEATFSMMIYNRNNTYNLVLDGSPRPGFLTYGNYDFFLYVHDSDQMNVTFTTRENVPVKGSGLQTYVGRGYQPSRTHFDFISEVKDGIGTLVYQNAQKGDHLYVSCYIGTGGDSAEYDIKVSGN